LNKETTIKCSKLRVQTKCIIWAIETKYNLKILYELNAYSSNLLKHLLQQFKQGMIIEGNLIHPKDKIQH